MWWGGKPEEIEEPRVVEPDVGSEGSDSPPVDLMAEEDDEITKTLGADDQDDDSGDDFGDLHEKFAAQEKLLGELRGAFEKNVAKQQLREKEFAGGSHYLGSNYLSRSTSTPVVIPRHEEPEHDSPRPSKLKLFKKELDEARQRENEDYREQKQLEQMVRQLQMELAERDKMITSLREETFSVASMSFAGSPIQSPYVMSPGRGSPTDTSPSHTPPLGSSVDSATSFSLRAISDNKYLALKEKNIELERKILDLEESLREKDELIRARTQAVTLMSADLSAKGKTTLDQLEETRSEMKKMQAAFAEKEAEWREQMSMLKKELVSKDKKVQSLEDSSNRLEQVRFELSTKNAELQEKVAALQTDLLEKKEATREITRAKEEQQLDYERKVLNLERRLELAESSRSVGHEKFLDEVRQLLSESDVAEKLVEVQNQVAVLEEEKGNLQLKLVEFEETAAKEVKTLEEIRALSDKLAKQESSVQEYKDTIDRILSEKMDLQTVIAHLEEDISKLTVQVSELECANEAVTDSKVQVELRAVELEEQRDQAREECRELEITIANVKTELQDQLHQYNELKQEHSHLVVEYHTLEANVTKYQSSQKIFDQDFVEKSSRIKELSISVAQLEKVIEAKNVEIGETLAVLEDVKADRVQAQQRVASLENVVQENQTKIESLSALLDESVAHQQLTDLSHQVSDLQTKIDILEDLKSDREKTVESLQLLLSESNTESAALRQQIEELQTLLNSSQSNLQESENIREQIINERNQLNDQITVLEEEKLIINEEKSRLEAECSQLSALSKSLESSVDELTSTKASLENRIVELEAERNEVSSNFDDLKSSYNKLNNDLEEHKKMLADLQKEHASMQAEASSLEDKHASESVRLRELEGEIQEKTERISALELQLAEQKRGVEELRTMCNEKESDVIRLEAEILETCSKSEDKIAQNRVENEKKLNSVESRLGEARAEIESLRSRLHELELINNDQVATIDTLNSKIKGLEAQADPPVVVEEDDDDGWKEDFTGFGSDEVVLPEVAAPLQAEVEDRRDDVVLQLRSELEELRTKLSQVEREKEETDQIVTSLRGRITELEVATEPAGAWNEDFDGFGSEEKSTVKAEEYEAVCEELERSRAEAEAVRTRLEAAEKDKASQALTLKELEEKLANLEVRTQSGDGWTDFDPFSNDNIDQVKTELSQVRAQLGETEAKLSQAKQEKEELSARVQLLEEQPRDATAVNEGWDEDFIGFGNDDLKTDLDQAKAELEEIKVALANAERENCDKQQLVEDLRTRLTALESIKPPDGDGWSEDFSDFGTVNVDEVQNELLEARSELHRVREALQAAERERDEQASAVSELQSRLESNEQGWGEDFSGFGKVEQPQVGELQARVDEQQAVIAVLEKSVSDLEEKNRQLEETLASVTSQHEESVSSLRHELKEKESFSSALSLELEQVNNLLAMKESEVEALNGDASKLRAELESIRNENRDLESAKSQTENRLKSLESSYNLIVAQQSVDVQTVLAEKDALLQKNNFITDKCKKLAVKLKQVDAKNKEFNAELSASQVEIESLKAELEALKRERSSLEEKRREIQTQLDEKSELLSQVSEKLQSIEALLAEKESSYDKLCKEFDETSKSFDELKSKFETLVDEKTEDAKLIETLKTERETLGKEVEELESAALDVKLQLQQVTFEKAELVESALKVSLEKNQLVAEIDALKASTEILTADCKSLRLQVEQLEAESVDSKVSLESRDQLVRTLQEKLQQLEENSDHKDLISSKDQIIQDQRVEIDRLGEELASARQTQSEITSTNQKLIEIENELMLARENLNTSQLENEQLKTRISSLADSEAAAGALKWRVSELEELVEKMNEESRLENQQKYEGESEAMREQLESLQAEVTSKDEEVLRISAQLSEKIEEMGRVGRELEDRVRDLDSARSQIENLERELAQRNGELEQIRAQQRPLDIAEISRPPPDVTQYQGVQAQPDVANLPAASLFQPDLMPQYTFRAEPGQNELFSNVAGEGDGWGSGVWGDADDWFAGAQPPVEQLPQQPQEPEVYQQAQLLQYQAPIQHDSVNVGDYNLLRQQVASMEAEVVTLRESLSVKTEECAKLQEDLAKINGEVEHLNQVIASKEDQVSNLQSTVQQVRADIDLANATYSQNVESLRSQHSSEVACLQNESKLAQENNEALELELKIMEQECSDLKDTIVKMEDKIKILESTNQKLKTKSSEVAPVEVQAEGDEVDRTTSNAPAPELPPSSCETGTPQSPPVASSYFTWDSSSYDPFTSQQDDFTSHAQPSFPSVSQPQEWPVQQEYFQQPFDQPQSIWPMEQQLPVAHDPHSSHEIPGSNALAILEKQLEELKTSSELERVRREDELRALGEQIVNLQSSLDSANVSKQRLEEELSSLPSWSQLDSLKEEKEHLQALISYNESKIGELQGKVDDLEPSLAACSATIKNLELEREEMRQKISALENLPSSDGIESLTEKVSNLELLNQELNRQVESYVASTQEFESERNNLLQKISETENNLLVIDELNRKISQLESENVDLTKKFEETRKSKEVEAAPTMPAAPEEQLDEPTAVFQFSGEEAFDSSSYFGQELVGTDGSDLLQPAVAEGFEAVAETTAISSTTAGNEQTLPVQTVEASVEWYQNELARYQAAITDWQTWAETQNTEYANIQATLAQYVEAYNGISAELAQLKSAEPTGEDSQQRDDEIAKFKAAVKAKDIEIDDLMETVDRLKTEKENLEQEIRELSTRNEELLVNNEVPLENERLLGRVDSQETDYYTLYEETKFNLDSTNEAKDKLARELATVRDDLVQQKSLSSELEERRKSLETSLQESELKISELEKECEQLRAERSRLVDRVDTLEEGNERFFELKEKQDKEIEMLRAFESDWKRRHDALQWQLSEMEQQMENQKMNVLKSDREQELLNKVAKLQEEVTNVMGQNLVLKNNQDANFKEQAALKMDILSMKQKLNETEQTNDFLKDQLREAGVATMNLQREKEIFEKDNTEIRTLFENAITNLEVLKNIQIERDNLSQKCEELEDQIEKLETENLSLKTRLTNLERGSSSPSKEYTDFQNLNQSLQTEITSLRDYIGQQQQVIANLQQTTAMNSSDVVSSLQYEVAEKNSQLAQLQVEVEALRKARDDSFETASVGDREAEIRRLFEHDQSESNMSLENERLKSDLDKSVRENRQLSHQLESWKKQLTSFDESDSAAAHVPDDDDDESPEVLRMRHDQACRSVAALQLRVEELTLEVTKLLEERDTLQLKLSNVMRQFERHKESASRASTARSTPVPWMTLVDNTNDVRELKMKIQELGRLNYALDIELQKEREARNQMHVRLTGTPRRHVEPRRTDSISSAEHSTPGSVIHL